MNESAKHFSNLSLANGCVQPGDKVSCSSTAGWTSLLVQTFEHPVNVESFETLPSPDHLISLVREGEFEIESFSSRLWKKAFYRPGCGGMTPPGKTDRLSWRSKTSDRHNTQRIYIPQYFFAAAADEYRRAGTSIKLDSLNALCFHDPVIAQIGFSLSDAIRAGAPNLYAESAAQFLANHLLSMHGKWSEPSSGTRKPGVMSDRRFERVLGFIEQNYMKNPSLAQLAKEVGVSRFHFIRLFRNKCGITPHQYLIRLRMSLAGSLLEDVNLSTKAIAGKCGYASVDHFAIAFKKHFSQTPAEYQKRFAQPHIFNESRIN